MCVCVCWTLKKWIFMRKIDPIILPVFGIKSTWIRCSCSGVYDSLFCFMFKMNDSIEIISSFELLMFLVYRFRFCQARACTKSSSYLLVLILKKKFHKNRRYIRNSTKEIRSRKCSLSIEIVRTLMPTEHVILQFVRALIIGKWQKNEMTK